MSTAKNQPSKSHSSLQSTRQLLDELDVMMQRMLELPAGETASESEEQAITTLTEAPVQDLTLPSEVERDEGFTPLPLPPEPDFPSYQHEPEPEAELEPEPHSKAHHLTPTPPAREFVGMLEEQEKVDLPPEPANEPDPSTQLLPPASPALNSPLIQPRRRWWYGPLHAINRAFDAVTLLFGPLGGWLRKPVGRNAMGWLGIGLLTAALVWQVLLWTVWK